MSRILCLLGVTLLSLCNVVISTIPKVVDPSKIYLSLSSSYDPNADQAVCVGERTRIDFAMYPPSVAGQPARLSFRYERVVFLKGYSGSTCPGLWLGTVQSGDECCRVSEYLEPQPADGSSEGFPVLPSDWAFPSGQAKLRLTLPVAPKYTQKGFRDITLPIDTVTLRLTLGCENNLVDPAGTFTCINKEYNADGLTTFDLWGDVSNGHLTVSGTIKGAGIGISFSPTTDVVTVTGTLLSKKSLSYFQNPNPVILQSAEVGIQFPVPL